MKKHLTRLKPLRLCLSLCLMGFVFFFSDVTAEARENAFELPASSSVKPGYVSVGDTYTAPVYFPGVVYFDGPGRNAVEYEVSTTITDMPMYGIGYLSNPRLIIEGNVIYGTYVNTPSRIIFNGYVETAFPSSHCTLVFDFNYSYDDLVASSVPDVMFVSPTVNIKVGMYNGTSLRPASTQNVFDSQNAQLQQQQNQLQQQQNDLTQQQTQQQHQDANNIMNGFDSTQGNSSLGSFNEGIGQYEDAQSSITDSAYDHLDDFTIPGGGIGELAFNLTASIPVVSAMLQSIFQASGDFTIIMTVTLTLTIVCMLLGIAKYFMR